MTLLGMDKKILITGITGFLGSHLGRYFLNKGYMVIGLKRSSSDTWRCKEYYKKVLWLDLDVEEWESKASVLKPEIIIHAAWNGVTSDDRNNLQEQLSNLELLAKLLSVAKKCSAKRFIALGSQAEYGQLNKIVSEEDTLTADSAYGIVKVMASQMVNFFCTANNINWYWLRVFSVFGEKESKQWLITSVINQLLLNKPELIFSVATQKYAYMYVEDFTKMVFEIAEKTPFPNSGIYNISAKDAVSLKSIIERIKKLSNNRNSVLSFGKLPLRARQSTHIEGNMSKFLQNVCSIQYSDIDKSLNKTIKYLKESLANNTPS